MNIIIIIGVKAFSQYMIVYDSTTQLYSCCSTNNQNFCSFCSVVCEKLPYIIAVECCMLVLHTERYWVYTRSYIGYIFIPLYIVVVVLITDVLLKSGLWRSFRCHAKPAEGPCDILHPTLLVIGALNKRGLSLSRSRSTCVFREISMG